MNCSACGQNPKSGQNQLAVDSLPDPRRRTPQQVEKRAKKAHAARPLNPNAAKKGAAEPLIVPLATNRSGQKTARSDDSGGIHPNTVQFQLGLRVLYTRIYRYNVRVFKIVSIRILTQNLCVCASQLLRLRRWRPRRRRRRRPQWQKLQRRRRRRR